MRRTVLALTVVLILASCARPGVTPAPPATDPPGQVAAWCFAVETWVDDFEQRRSRLGVRPGERKRAESEELDLRNQIVSGAPPTISSYMATISTVSLSTRSVKDHSARQTAHKMVTTYLAVNCDYAYSFATLDFTLLPTVVTQF